MTCRRSVNHKSVDRTIAEPRVPQTMAMSGLCPERLKHLYPVHPTWQRHLKEAGPSFSHFEFSGQESARR